MASSRSATGPLISCEADAELRRSTCGRGEKIGTSAALHGDLSSHLLDLKTRSWNSEQLGVTEEKGTRPLEPSAQSRSHVRREGDERNVRFGVESTNVVYPGSGMIVACPT